MYKPLNETIKKINDTVYELLSDKGKKYFFPKHGILAQAAEAKNKAINASIGAAYEDDLSPMRLLCVDKNITLPPEDVYPYITSFGLEELRNRWKALMQKKNPSLDDNFSLPVVSHALSHGLNLIGNLFINPNDKIILPDMFWGNYKMAIETTHGGVLDTFNTFRDNSFDLTSFQNKLNESISKKIVLLNFPNNPTGYTLANKEAEELVAILKDSADKGNKLAIILDDAYFGLVYEKDVFKESLFTKLNNLHENILAIKLDGCTKEDYVWGLRVGFITYGIKDGTKELYGSLEDKTAGAVRGSISNVSHLSQSIMVEAYKDQGYWAQKREKYKILETRYQTVKDTVYKYKKYFVTLPFNSGYFMCIKILNGLNADILRKHLLKEYDTGVISIREDLIRIAFSSVPKRLIPKLFENIYNACKDIINSI